MTNKLFEHTVLYDSGDAFFELKGNASMKLSPKAAIEVCNEAAKKGLWILGIDGGHWLNPGFRIDSSASSSRQPGGCGLSWSELTVIKTDNIIVFQLVIWPVQLNPVNENLPLKEANFPAMS